MTNWRRKSIIVRHYTSIDTYAFPPDKIKLFMNDLCLQLIS